MPSHYVKKYPNGRHQRVTCQVCGKPFTVPNRSLKRGQGKFCSRACKAESQRVGIIVRCPICNKPMRIRPSDSKKGKKYCSWACRCKGFRGDGNPNWADDPDYRGHDWNETRQTALERDQYTCTECGATDVFLAVHHRIPWSESHDNSLGNLQTVCVPCHMKFHHQND